MCSQSYASILYLRLSPGFRIILRGKDVEHHNLVDDMMNCEEITYRPQPIGDETSKDPNVTSFFSSKVSSLILEVFLTLLAFLTITGFLIIGSRAGNYWFREGCRTSHRYSRFQRISQESAN